MQDLVQQQPHWRAASLLERPDKSDCPVRSLLPAFTAAVDLRQLVPPSYGHGAFRHQQSYVWNVFVVALHTPRQWPALWSTIT
jgi:hypothetical protein